MKNTDNRWRIFTVGAFLALFAAMVFFLNGCWAGFGAPHGGGHSGYHHGYHGCPSCGHVHADTQSAPQAPQAPSYAPAPQGGNATAQHGGQSFCQQCNAYH